MGIIINRPRPMALFAALLMTAGMPAEARIVQIDDAGTEVPGTSRKLTFGGEEGAVIPRGAPFVSDAVDLKVPDLSRLKIEFHLPGSTGPCTCHQIGLDTLAVSPPGNHVGEAWQPASTAQFRAFLTGVETFSPESPGTIVALGDSITDGVGSTPGANRAGPTSWPTACRRPTSHTRSPTPGSAAIGRSAPAWAKARSPGSTRTC